MFLWHNNICSNTQREELDEVSSVIVGRNIHNQRIERHVIFFRDAFNFLLFLLFFGGLCGLFHVSDELDIYALQFAFLPMIQELLHSFKAGWSQHSMRTKNNRTPMQLWVAGLPEINKEMSQGIAAVNNTYKITTHVTQFQLSHEFSVVCFVFEMKPCL